MYAQSTSMEPVKLTIEQCLDSFVVPNLEGDFQLAAETKQKLAAKLLMPLLERLYGNEIPADEIPKIWTFVLIGHWTRNFFAVDLQLPENPLPEYLNHTVADIVNNGPLIYNICYSFESFSNRIALAKKRYETIFSTEDPIDWYEKNGGCDFTENMDAFRPAGLLANKIQTALSTKCDPIYQV
jgi:hypothetical protein